MSVNVQYADLPCTIRGFTVREYSDDEYYTIVLNSRLSYDVNISSYLHEMEHIIYDDFELIKQGVDVNCIESIRHK